MLYKILFASFLLLCFSCQGEQDKTSMNVGDDICTCFKPLVDVNDEIQTMIKNGDNSQAENLISKVEQLNTEGQSCAANMVKKYGADTQLDTDKISAHMKEKCPKILKIVGEALFVK